MGKIFLIKARLENENEKLAQNIADCPFRLRNRLYKRFSRRRRRRAGRRRFSRALRPAAEKNAHATALLVILPISLISALVYLLNGSVDWEYTLFATIGVVAGGAAGALLLNRLSGNVVKLIFSLLLLASGVRMFFMTVWLIVFGFMIGYTRRAWAWAAARF